MRDRPKFAAAMLEARLAGGAPLRPGGRSTYCVETAQAILARMWAGEAIIRICLDPDMPAVATVYRWRADVPAFGRALADAFEIRAEGFFEKGWEIAEAITPESAFADKVRLTHLRWHVGKLAPKRYGLAAERVATVEALGALEGKGEGLTVIVKRFTDAPDPDLDGAVLAPGEERLLYGPGRQLRPTVPPPP